MKFLASFVEVVWIYKHLFRFIPRKRFSTFWLWGYMVSSINDVELSWFWIPSVVVAKLNFLKLNRLIYLKTHWCNLPNVMLAGGFQRRGNGVNTPAPSIEIKNILRSFAFCLRLIFTGLFKSLCFAWRCLVMLNRFKFRSFF